MVPNVEDIALALGARRTGSGWLAKCPAHNDKNPSLSISLTESGKLLVYCHAGCDQRSVIAALSAMGLWSLRQSDEFVTQAHGRDWRAEQQRDELKRIENALRVWRQTVAPADTLLETYWKNRAIEVQHPPSIRFHPRLKHPSGAVLPAMVGLVTDPAHGPIAVHRTFLTANGDKAPVIMPKMALGPLKGGAVELGTPEAVTGVSEGIETGLSASQIHGVPVLAALGMRMDRVQLPEAASHIVIFGDNGDVGRRAARKAQMAILRSGRTVELCFPPAGYGDWNDLVRDQAQKP